MNKTRLLSVLLTLFVSLSIISIVPVSGSDDSELCDGADLIIPVDMMVVGDGCYRENLIEDSTQIEISETADYEIYGIVSRGNPGQTQTKEEFYLMINGNQSQISVDDPEPGAITIRREFFLYQYLTQGTHEVIMHTAAQCPPDTTANSVRLTHLCLYKQDIPVVPEFGFYAGLLTIIGAAGLFFIIRRK